MAFAAMATRAISRIPATSRAWPVSAEISGPATTRTMRPASGTRSVGSSHVMSASYRRRDRWNVWLDVPTGKGRLRQETLEGHRTSRYLDTFSIVDGARSRVTETAVGTWQ